MESALVITGLGLTTGLGRGVDANWEALCAGRSGLREVASLDVSAYPIQLGGEAPPHREGSEADRRERAHTYLVQACREALSAAGIEETVPVPARASLVLGSSLAAQASAPLFWASYLAEGPGGAAYEHLRSYDLEPRIASLCATLGIQGEALLVSNACAAGASALALAGDLIRLGRTDLAVVAGFDALDLHTFSGFGGINALAPDTIRPFGSERQGMLLGDGFGALILEREESARAAGRRPLARLLGYGESSDAHHLTQPDPEGKGAALAMRRALAAAERTPDDVEYINCHSTATPSNDIAEARAMRGVFGERLAEIPIGASKPAVGHTLGGAGAVEGVITLLTMLRGTLPPILNAGDVDPECGELDLVREPRDAALRTAMSNSFGFGGCNTSLLFGRCEEPS